VFDYLFSVLSIFSEKTATVKNKKKMIINSIRGFITQRRPLIKLLGKMSRERRSVLLRYPRFIGHKQYIMLLGATSF